MGYYDEDNDTPEKRVARQVAGTTSSLADYNLAMGKISYEKSQVEKAKARMILSVNDC